MAKKKKKRQLIKEKTKLNLVEKLLFETSYIFASKSNLKTAKEKAAHKKAYLENLTTDYLTRRENKRIDILEKRAMNNKVTRKSLEKFNELFPPPPEAKDINKMNNEEFYNYLMEYQTANESFLDFLFDYIATAYLEGDLSSQDISNIVNAPSAFEIKNYIDSKLNDIKYKYSLAEEVLKYSDKEQPGSELLQELMPEQTEDQPKESADRFKIKTIENFKKLLQNNFPDMENMKKEMEKAKMIRAEKERIAKQRKMILANSPEALDLVKKKDGFASEKNQQAATDKFIEKESQKEEQKKVVLRKAKRPMTPSELIAEKKRLMQNISTQQQSSGLDLKT